MARRKMRYSARTSRDQRRPAPHPIDLLSLDAIRRVDRPPPRTAAAARRPRAGSVGSPFAAPQPGGGRRRGQEAYYAASVADGLDDYYAGRGEAPTRIRNLTPSPTPSATASCGSPCGSLTSPKIPLNPHTRRCLARSALHAGSPGFESLTANRLSGAIACHDRAGYLVSVA
jgi:hypothetical protein